MTSTADWPEWEDDPIEVPHLVAANGHDVLSDRTFTPTPFVYRDPATMPRREWLYGRHLIRRYVSTTISPGGIGKSSLLLAEAVAMASGRDFLGERIEGGPLKVWYWNGEDPQDENERRILATMIHHKIKPEELDGQLFIDTGREKEIMLAALDRGQLTVAEELITTLVNQLVAHKIDVLILDPFVSTHGIGENDNTGINAVVRALARLAERANVAVELVHHVRKPSAGSVNPTDVNDARGASALIGGVRSARVLNVMTTEEAQTVGVEPNARLRYFRVDNGKSNLAPRGDVATWRHIASVPLHNGTTTALDDGDHVGVVEKYDMPDEWSRLPANAAQIAQEIAAANDHARVDPRSPDWFGHLVAPHLGMDSTDKAGKITLQRLIETWIKTGVLGQRLQPDRSRVPRQHVIPGAGYSPLKSVETPVEPIGDPDDDLPF